MWLFLADTLSDSASHDDATSRTIYSRIVSLIYGLVRLRRDLVIDSLPHLAHTLSRLLECLQAVRQDLGAIQRRSITNTFPLWIQPSQPLGAEDAKATARLLESLTTRTEVHSTSYAASSVGTAESLAHPLSKHGPYVLVAYIRALTNPLGFFSIEIRRELEPGFFALCSMMNKHVRDSIMISMLDGGERAMLKLIWEKYEKQKYVGRG